MTNQVGDEITLRDIHGKFRRLKIKGYYYQKPALRFEHSNFIIRIESEAASMTQSTANVKQIDLESGAIVLGTIDVDRIGRPVSLKRLKKIKEGLIRQLQAY